MRSIGKILRRLAYALGGVLLLVGIVLALGAVPFGAKSNAVTNDGKKVRIYVLSNGFHSDIALPKQWAQSGLPIRVEDFSVNHDAVQYYAVGWGSKVAFTSLLAVSDLTPSIIARALAFDETVMHVTPLGALQPQDGLYALDVSEAQLVQLIDEMNRWFTSPKPMAGITQGFGDRFYKSRGYFAPWATCNSWTGRRLRKIGINIGLWTPIAQTLEFGLATSSVNP